MTENTPIERVFLRLAATYGAAWDRALGQAPIGDVKTVWAHELSAFLQTREAMKRIAWALENLPERCPNAIEFRNLCRQSPAADVPQLAAQETAADPSRVAAELAKLRSLQTRQTAAISGCRNWARAILARVERGDRVSPTVVAMAKHALGNATSVEV